MPTYTYTWNKKEHCKCQLAPAQRARKSRASAYLDLHREQERAQQVPTNTYIGSKKEAEQTYIGIKKEHSKSTYINIGCKGEHKKCLLTPTHMEQERAKKVSTYTYIGGKKEHSKCLLTPTQGARKSTASVYLHLHSEQERAQQVSTYICIGSKKVHTKFLLTPSQGARMSTTSVNFHLHREQ